MVKEAVVTVAVAVEAVALHVRASYMDGLSESNFV